MNNIRNWIVSLVIIATAGGALFAMATPQTAFAVADTKDCNSGLLGFPTWYRGLTESDTDCKLKSPNDVSGKLSGYIWTIALNILDIALMIVGYASVAYILYGGFLLMTARGKPDYISEGQVTIRNAVIGLVISFGSVAVVDFIGGNIIGKATSNVFGVPIVNANDVFANGLFVVYMVAGITAVISIIIAGYMYTISGGNPAEVEKSKNSILYSVIGLIVIGFAFVITNFLIGRF